MEGVDEDIILVIIVFAGVIVQLKIVREVTRRRRPAEAAVEITAEPLRATRVAADSVATFRQEKN